MKKTNNKGFSLVELIVVVAIMAVLMVVLAPQLLRYVEQSRLQRDNSALSEIANAVEIAMANETINSSVTTDAAGQQVMSITAGVTGNDYTFGGEATPTALQSELALSIGAVELTSNTYAGDTLVMTVYKNTNGTIEVKITNWMDSTTDTAHEHTF